MFTICTATPSNAADAEMTYWQCKYPFDNVHQHRLVSVKYTSTHYSLVICVLVIWTPKHFVHMMHPFLSM